MKKLFIFLIIILAILAAIFYLSRAPFGVTKDIKWGTAFSKPFAIEMGLDWQETYLAILDGLKPPSLRLPIYWEDVEPKTGEFDFKDYDWMISEAEKRNIKLILVIGRKLPRWPECHLPAWASSLDSAGQQEQVLNLLTQIVGKYKETPNLYLWQVENEPFLNFGECPLFGADFLGKEVSLVKSLDSQHKIMVTDSGELSMWVQAAKQADVFGTTMYRTVYNKYIGYLVYPLPPRFFWLKTNIVHWFYPGRPIIVSELQAEPWGPKLLYETSLEEQAKSMNIEQFHANIEYAKQVGFPEVYLWGAEWWYWMKTKHNDDRFWETAKIVISQ
jgi:hypothetical protein